MLSIDTVEYTSGVMNALSSHRNKISMQNLFRHGAHEENEIYEDNVYLCCLDDNWVAAIEQKDVAPAEDRLKSQHC